MLGMVEGEQPCGRPAARRCSAGASLNEPPRTTTIGPQFSGDLFLAVTLQNNNRHASAQKIFPYVISDS